MIPVAQTKLYRPEGHPEGAQHGNCQRAAMASILEIGIDDMPTFEDEPDAGAFWNAIRTWLRGRGLRQRYHPAAEPPAGYALAYGPAARGVDHAVVVRSGVLAWDPHPDGTGLLSVKRFASLVPAMTKGEFTNALRVPWNIDRHQAAQAFPPGPDGDALWAMFRDAPHRFLTQAADETFDRLWPAIEARL